VREYSVNRKKGDVSMHFSPMRTTTPVVSRLAIGIGFCTLGWLLLCPGFLRAQDADLRGVKSSGGEVESADAALFQPGAKPSVIRVNVTNQAWDFVRPWGKRPPFSRRAIGAVLRDLRVLVTAELVANSNYVELEVPDGGAKVPAVVEVIDYEANLALLRGEDPKFMEQFAGLDLAGAVAGDTVSVLQLENTGTVLATKSTVSTVEVGRYPIDEAPLLVYRTTVPLQFRDSGFTLPVVKGGRLVGMIMRYDNNTKSAELLPAPVIEHFLKDASDGHYEGFARLGMSYSNTRDPQLRRYIGMLNGTPGGVYVTDVASGGAAYLGGIRKGDVVLKVAGLQVDQDGNYSDPTYGKIAVTHLIGTRHFVGDTVGFTVFREGRSVEVPVKLATRSVNQMVVESHVIDRPPEFYLLGGLLFQELSRQYLKEWGPEWSKKAPEEFLYIDRYQNELFPEGGRKVVILSGVLPSGATIGYEGLHQIVLSEINGVPINRLSDIPSALEKATSGMHRIDFNGDPGTIYLDVAAVAEGDRALQSNYGIPLLHRLK
jgi:S1-C subfamily serine protease